VNISSPFIERPIATALLAVGLLLLGVAAYPLLPIAPLPQVDFPTIQVTASLPGASPDTMASNVAQPLERQFSQIPGVSQLTSQSQLGTSAITVVFDLSRNLDGAATDIQAAINAAGGQLPSNLPSPPTYRKVNPADAPILVMAVSSDTLPITQVNDYADNILSQQLSRVPGVGLVSINGQQKPAVRIQLDPAKLAAIGLGLDDVRAVLATVTVNAPKGIVDGPQQSFTVYDNDQLTVAAPWQDVIVAWRGGAPVRIRDLGQAVDGAENTKLAGWAGKKPAIILAVSKLPGANVIATVDAIQAALPHLRAAIPPAVDIQILTDRTQTIRASVSDVETTLAITVGLVVAVIFVFLRTLPGTLIPAAAVPLSLTGTAGVMAALGYSLDNLSLMGLSIAIGFVVDDAIVMLENIYRHVEDGMAPMEAALKGAGEIGFTIVSISLSLVAVFIPLLLMGGIVGRLFREFAVTVTATILISGLVSLTLTPMLCARFLRDPRQAKHGRLYALSERLFAAMQDRYGRALDVALRHRLLTLLVFLGTLALTGWLYVVVPKGFFPQQDTGFIFGQIEGNQEISSAAMKARTQAVAALVGEDPDVASFASAFGATTFNQANLYINLKPRDQRQASADQVVARLGARMQEVEGVRAYFQVSQDINIGGRLSRTQYQYTLVDPDAAELNAWAPRIQEKLQSLPQLQDLATDQQANGGAAWLTVDRERAASFGIQPALIDATIYDAIGQRQVAQYYTQVNSYHVVLEVLPEMQLDLALFDKLYLPSPVTGGQVPLSTFVRLDTGRTGPLQVSHQNQFAAVTLSFNLPSGGALGDAVAAIGQAQRALGVPDTLAGSFQGNAQAFQSSLSTEPPLILAALVVVYIILGVLYESVVHPLTILSTLPSAGVGALLALLAAGLPLDVIGLIGLVLLIGIVKKNGIMLVDFAIEAERGGMAPEESMRQACLMRFRPILMTTMCAILGALPLLFASGTGSEIRRPLGVAMVGGLAVSQVLTLFTTPVVYLYLDRLAKWRRPARAGAGRPAVPVQPVT